MYGSLIVIIEVVQPPAIGYNIQTAQNTREKIWQQYSNSTKWPGKNPSARKFKSVC
jgi:hypothetical protein